uniref:Uncharacterized protein n=1 Tax=Thermus sp. 4C TaxID=446041 RepID=A6MN68_9DEIN|nr:hypothetical protein [Thermus sp. 4C]
MRRLRARSRSPENDEVEAPRNFLLTQQATQAAWKFGNIDGFRPVVLPPPHRHFVEQTLYGLRNGLFRGLVFSLRKGQISRQGVNLVFPRHGKILLGYHHLHHHLPRPQVPHLDLHHPPRDGGAHELGLGGALLAPEEAGLGKAGLPDGLLQAGLLPGAVQGQAGQAGLGLLKPGLPLGEAEGGLGPLGHQVAQAAHLVPQAGKLPPEGLPLRPAPLLRPGKLPLQAGRLLRLGLGLVLEVPQGGLVHPAGDGLPLLHPVPRLHQKPREGGEGEDQGVKGGQGGEGGELQGGLLPGGEGRPDHGASRLEVEAREGGQVLGAGGVEAEAGRALGGLHPGVGAHRGDEGRGGGGGAGLPGDPDPPGGAGEGLQEVGEEPPREVKPPLPEDLGPPPDHAHPVGHHLAVPAHRQGAAQLVLHQDALPPQGLHHQEAPLHGLLGLAVEAPHLGPDLPAVPPVQVVQHGHLRRPHQVAEGGGEALAREGPEGEAGEGEEEGQGGLLGGGVADPPLPGGEEEELHPPGPEEGHPVHIQGVQEQVAEVPGQEGPVGAGSHPPEGVEEKGKGEEDGDGVGEGTVAEAPLQEGGKGAHELPGPGGGGVYVGHHRSPGQGQALQEAHLHPEAPQEGSGEGGPGQVGPRGHRLRASSRILRARSSSGTRAG